MGFEYQREYGKLHNTYSDKLLDSIFHKKEDLKIDIDKELDNLKELYEDLEKQLETFKKKRDAFVDWESDEFDEIYNDCRDLEEKLEVLENIIDYLEDLSEKL